MNKFKGFQLDEVITILSQPTNEIQTEKVEVNNSLDTRLANLEKMFSDLNESLKKNKKKKKSISNNSDAESSDSDNSTISKRSHKSVDSSKSKNSTKSLKRTRHCNKCGKDNHFSKDCRLLKSKLFCSHCNTTGSHTLKASKQSR